MEQDILDLTARKLCSFLSLCGVSDSGQESIKSHILSIAECVHESRLEAGLKGIPDCLKNQDMSLSTNKSRQSNRILSSAEKRGRPDYSGQDDRPRHKKPKCAMCRKNMKATGLTKTEKSRGESDLEEASNAEADEVAIGEDNDDEDNGDEDNNEEDSDKENNGEKVNGEEDTGEGDTGRNGAENVQEVMPASASHPAARQAEPITDLPTALTGSTPEAPLLDRSNTVYCPKVSETEREIHRQVNDVLRLPYEKAVPEIKKEHTAFYSKKMQARYMETIFWHFIEEAAKEINPEDCPVPKGPLDGFTRQEKRAHLQFMEDAGYKTGATNVRHYRRLWKNLYTMREGGVDKILLYRTKEFDSFCESFHTDATPLLLDIVKRWEESYGPQISLLERRIENAARNGLSEDLMRSQPEIAERLKVESRASGTVMATAGTQTRSQQASPQPTGLSLATVPHME
ncbi:hypothetical protein ED733_000110, partial [Metarhizium rileyi]